MRHRAFINSGEQLPCWTNPISHAVVANDMCFVSGQLSVGVDGRFLSGTLRGEAVRAFANLFAVLRAAGFAKEELVFVDIAFTDLAGLDVVNKLYCEYFSEERRPARTVYQVGALPFGGKIKVMGTAVRNNLNAQGL